MKLSEKLGEHSKRGDVSAIIYNLNVAYDKGLLGGKSKLFKFINEVTKNFTKQKSRYGKFTKQLYEGLRTIGGPRAARFLAFNLAGPSDDTQRRYRRQNKFDYYPEEPNERVQACCKSVLRYHVQ